MNIHQACWKWLRLVLIWALVSCVSERSGDIRKNDDPSDVKAHVDSCHDGDTCRIRIGDTLSLNMRLAGIDAPEVGRRSHPEAQPLGAAAQAFLEMHVRDRDVTLRSIDLDPYNRPVVEIRVDGVLINVQLVEAGLAEVYRSAPKTLDLGPYLKAEAAAKNAGRGVWGLTSYVRPTDFRHRRRSKVASPVSEDLH